MIVDVHTHIFPSHRASKILRELGEKAGLPCYCDGTADDLVRSMDQGGVDLALVSRIATGPEKVAPINQWVLRSKGRRTHPMATMHPDLLMGTDRIRKLKNQGFVGFKIHPDFQGFYVDDKRAYPFYEAAQAEGMPILFHAGVDRGLPYPVHSTPERLARVLRDFPHPLP